MKLVSEDEISCEIGYRSAGRRKYKVENSG